MMHLTMLTQIFMTNPSPWLAKALEQATAYVRANTDSKNYDCQTSTRGHSEGVTLYGLKPGGSGYMVEVLYREMQCKQVRMGAMDY